MANLQCQPATNVTATTATLNGTADSIPANHFLRFAYGAISGGPYSSFTPNVAGTNSLNQSISSPVSDLDYDADYFYVVQELDTDGVTVIDSSEECTFHTEEFNPQCALISSDGFFANVQATADWVPPTSELLIEYSTSPGGPYTTLASAPGTNTAGQVLNAVLSGQDACGDVFFRARVDDIPVQYFATWSYAHGNRTGVPETVEMRLNGVLIDTDVVGPPVSTTPALWNVKNGVYPVPPGTTSLDMRFIAISPANGSDNHLDTMSIILTTSKGQNLGEQLTNGNWEIPVLAPNGIQFITNTDAAGIPGFGWRSTPIGGWPDGVIELWHNFFGGPGAPVAHSGDQHAEINAPGEIFQVAELARAFVASNDCEVSLICPANCEPATSVSFDSATLNASSAEFNTNNFYAFQYGTTPGGPYDHQTTLTLGNGGTTFSQPINALELNTTYYYRVVVFDNSMHIISTSDECQFTTEIRIKYCGMNFREDQCVLVDPGNGELYRYCLEF